jgi:colicin import membrane protein
MQKFKVLALSLSGTGNRVLRCGDVITEKDLVSTNIKGLQTAPEGKAPAIAKCDKDGKLLVPLKGKSKGKGAKPETAPDPKPTAKEKADAKAKAKAEAKEIADAKAKEIADAKAKEISDAKAKEEVKEEKK